MKLGRVGQIAIAFLLLGAGMGDDYPYRVSNYRETRFRQPPVLTFEGVSELIRSVDLRSAAGLLPLLPEDYRRHYTFLYKSHSLQPASPEFPRIVAYGGDARFLMAFEGDPSLPEFHTVETAELDEERGNYHFRRIVFDPAGMERPRVVDSPPVCASCHGQNTQPIWDAYPFWRGAYGSRSANLFDRITRGSIEDGYYQVFLSKERDRGLYQYLPKLGSNERLEKRIKRDGILLTFTSNGAASDPTAFLSEQLGEIRMRMAATEIRKSPVFPSFKQTLAFMALCENSILPKFKVIVSRPDGTEEETWQDNPDYIPPSGYLTDTQAATVPSFWGTYLRRVESDHKLRLREANFYNPPSPVLSPGGKYPVDEGTFRNFAAYRFEYKSGWVYVLGLMGLDPRQWAMSFDFGPLNLEEGGPPAYSRLGYLLFHDDPEVNRYFADPPNFLYQHASAESCRELAKASREARVGSTVDAGAAEPAKILEQVAPPGGSSSLPSGVPPVVAKCLACHAFSGGAAAIPFDRPVDMAAILGKPLDGGKPVENKPALYDDIIERVDSGDMPRRGSLTDSEKGELKAYLKKLAGKS